MHVCECVCLCDGCVVIVCVSGHVCIVIVGVCVGVCMFVIVCACMVFLCCVCRCFWPCLNVDCGCLRSCMHVCECV